ncbi:MAG: hypothetical protein IIB15_02935 [Chloroflexi bacterium]|nr:hypothetical protein [Chloroflexota bacterium]
MRRLKFLLWPILILVTIQVVIRIFAQVLRRRYLSQEVDEDSVNAVAVMGGWEDAVTSRDFKGGYLRAVLGGTELDLRDAFIEEKPATIEATIIMGGAEIKVPPEWKVKLDASLTMAGVEDKRGQDDLSEDETPDLVITGKIVMGGLEIS